MILPHEKYWMSQLAMELDFPGETSEVPPSSIQDTGPPVDSGFTVAFTKSVAKFMVYWELSIMVYQRTYLGGPIL